MGRPVIAIIGAGNVATHLAMALDEVADVVQVCSRHLSHASELAAKLKSCQPIDSVNDLTTEADLYIISVNDDAIESVAKSMPEVKGIVVHTSGSVGIDALDSKSGHRGVFYPLQTFSKDVMVDISKVPFFIEADTEDTCCWLESLALNLSTSVYRADSAQRTVLHIAAVFGCNFVNHLLDISSQILQENGYSLDVLYPLIRVTIDKAMNVGPHQAQTGPAARHDTGVIERHVNALNAERGAIYRLLSDSIMTSN